MSGCARLLAVCLLILLSTFPARAQDSTDRQYLQDRLAGDAELGRSRQQLGQVTAQSESLSAEIGALALSTEQLESELARTADLIAASEARLEGLATHSALIRDQHAEAAAELARAEATHEAHRRLASERLVNMYIFSTEHRTALSWQVDEVTDLESRHVILTMVGEHDKELLARLADSVVDIATRRQTLERLQRDVEELTRAEGEVLAEVGHQRALQEALAAELRLRVARLHAEIDALEQAADELQAIMARRVARIELEAAERDRLRRICYANPRRPLDTGGRWIDCPSVGVVIPPDAVRWPLADRVTSEYGPRWGRMHEGIDIAGGYGAPIVAAESGHIDHVGWIGGYGNTVIVDHGGGMTTLYAHLQAPAVVVGQTVDIGETVGHVGNTGYSQGPHLHFEVRINGAPVNPRKYLP